jgi:hypothetical protein
MNPAPVPGVPEWVSIKGSILAWAGIDSGAAHILASVLALLALAALLRRPFWSWLPWFAILILELLNEALTGLADGMIEDWELAGSLRDLLLVMAMPTILLLICRLAPGLVAPAPPSLKVSSPTVRSRDEIIDAEFEELP